MSRRPSAEQALFAAEPPKLTVQQAQALAARFYGLTASADILSSERDQNFLLKTAQGQAYVLKATHPAEDPAVTDFQTQAQLCLMQADEALPIPQLIRGVDGEYVHWHEDEDGSRRAIRLITFVHGTPQHKVPSSDAQRCALGTVLARFDQALSGFDHAMADHELLWDLQHADRIADLLPLIAEAPQRQLAERTLTRFVTQVQPGLKTLRRQVIHNDLNPYNVMVGAQNPDQIAALLDFGDMVRAPLVQDLAVACAYQLEDAADPLSRTARQCVAAYHRQLPLQEDEIAVLPDLIMARLLITVAITGWRARQHPENRQYILRNNGLAWTGLIRMDALAEGQAADFMAAALNSMENAA